MTELARTFDPEELEVLLWDIINCWAQVAPSPRASTEADDRLMIAILKARRVLLKRERKHDTSIR